MNIILRKLGSNKIVKGSKVLDSKKVERTKLFMNLYAIKENDPFVLRDGRSGKESVFVIFPSGKMLNLSKGFSDATDLLDSLMAGECYLSPLTEAEYNNRSIKKGDVLLAVRRKGEKVEMLIDRGSVYKPKSDIQGKSAHTICVDDLDGVRDMVADRAPNALDEILKSLTELDASLDKSIAELEARNKDADAALSVLTAKVLEREGKKKEEKAMRCNFGDVIKELNSLQEELAKSIAEGAAKAVRKVAETDAKDGYLDAANKLHETLVGFVEDEDSKHAKEFAELMGEHPKSVKVLKGKVASIDDLVERLKAIIPEDNEGSKVSVVLDASVLLDYASELQDYRHLDLELVMKRNGGRMSVICDGPYNGQWGPTRGNKKCRE